MIANEIAPRETLNQAKELTPFAIKDCALIAIATGQRAYTLRELRDKLLTITPDSIYQHFWGNLLEPRFEEREYNNDFAAWARRGLHDDKLAEKLSMVDPTNFADIEDLRQELIDIIDERLYESQHLMGRLATESFEFIRSQIVVFDSGKKINRPEQLADILPSLSVGSIFYHFIDARRRMSDRSDDFRRWLEASPKYSDLCNQLAAVDFYFVTLRELRQQLSMICSRYFGGTQS